MSDLDRAKDGCPECGGERAVFQGAFLGAAPERKPCPTCAHTARHRAEVREEWRKKMSILENKLTTLAISPAFSPYQRGQLFGIADAIQEAGK